MDNRKRGKYLEKGLAIIVAIGLIFVASYIDEFAEFFQYRPYSFGNNEIKVAQTNVSGSEICPYRVIFTFTDGTNDTLRVYTDNSYSVGLENGDLYYWRKGKTGGEKVVLASYVRSFDIYGTNAD